MERRGLKDATISSDPLWPAASVDGKGTNLFHAFGTIIHAQSLEIEWETADLKPPPYRGREARFVASVEAKSDKQTQCLPIGGIVASFFGSVLNRMEQATQ
jgi:hypothetical protein